MQDRSPKSIDQVLAVLENQNNHFAGLNLCKGQRARVGIRAAEELIHGKREIVGVGKLQGEGDPVRSPRMKRFEPLGEGRHFLRESMSAAS